MSYALISEPVNLVVEKERLSYRFSYAEAFEDLINDGIDAGEFVQQNAPTTAAALVGLLTETLVGPLAPHSANSNQDEQSKLSEHEKQILLSNISEMALRAVGSNVKGNYLNDCRSKISETAEYDNK